MNGDRNSLETPVNLSAPPLAPLPANEEARLAALQSYDILDTLPEPAIDDLSRITAQICGTPIALVSFVDRDRLWIKAKVGSKANEGPRQPSFCAHAVLNPNDILLVPDATQDPRFAQNPVVARPNGIRFYAGRPSSRKTATRWVRSARSIGNRASSRPHSSKPSLPSVVR